MSINNFASIFHITCNENRREEISVEYHRTLWQWLTRRPATVLTFERLGYDWYNKDTAELVDWYGKSKIERVKKELKYAGKIGQWD